MKKTPLIAIATIMVGFSSCNFFGNCLQGEGPIVEQVITIDTFDEIELEQKAEVYLKQASQQKVTIEAPQNIIDLLLTEVSGGTWNIDFSRCTKTEEPIKIYIETNDIQEITVEGSGKVFSEGLIESNELVLNINGSGLIDLNVMVKELKTEISGSGDVNLIGETKLHKIEINGSGDIDSYDLISDESEIEINGSGNVKVNVSYALDVDIDGSGDVYYKGNVKEISSQVNGSGKLNQEH
ncbi:MAG: hypothetical protein ACI91R_000283 [Vicingaceae bacterium]|jgi:hypothetical protein